MLGILQKKYSLKKRSFTRLYTNNVIFLKKSAYKAHETRHNSLVTHQATTGYLNDLVQFT